MSFLLIVSFTLLPVFFFFFLPFCMASLMHMPTSCSLVLCFS